MHPSLPAELQTIVLKVLAKEPSERYATARELADDLRLNEEQRAKVKDLSARVTKQWKESLSDIGRRSGAERARRSLEQARANEEDVKAILIPEQIRRLHQIGLQSDVPGAFREPEVAAVLKLTAEQRERIRTIEEEAFMGMLKSFWTELAPADADKDAAAPKNKPPNERILGLLTEAQARHWREMTGAPFKGSIPFPPPFGPGSPSLGSKAPI